MRDLVATATHLVVLTEEGRLVRLGHEGGSATPLEIPGLQPAGPLGEGAGRVLFGTGPRVVAVDPESAAVAWEARLAVSGDASVVEVFGEQVLVRVVEPYGAATHIAVLDVASGAARWSAQERGATFPARLGEAVAYQRWDRGDWLVQRSLATGDPNEPVMIDPDRLEVPVATLCGGLLVGARDGFRLLAPDGTILGILRTPAEPSSWLLPTPDALYLAVEDGSLFAVGDGMQCGTWASRSAGSGP